MLTLPGMEKFTYWNEITVNNEFYRDHICANEPARATCSAMFDAIADLPPTLSVSVADSKVSMANPGTTWGGKILVWAYKGFYVKDPSFNVLKYFRAGGRMLTISLSGWPFSFEISSGFSNTSYITIVLLVMFLAYHSNFGIISFTELILNFRWSCESKFLCSNEKF
jgi:hypothetical protein